MAHMELEVHFHAQDVVSVLVTSTVPAGEEEQAAELALFALVAARQISNLGRHPSGAGLASILAAVPAEALPEFADHDSPDGPRLVAYQGAPGRVRFSASLDMEPFRFRLDSRGMGFLAKGAAYYAPQSVMALLRHLAGRHRNDAAFLAGLAVTARVVGDAGRAGRITVTSQAEVAMTAFRAALVAAAATADVPSSPSDVVARMSLSDEEHIEALRTIYYGGTRFVAAAAQFALAEAAQAAAKAGPGPLGELTADVLAAVRLVAKRMPTHASRFGEQLAEVVGTVRQRTIADQARALLRSGLPVTSNGDLSAHYEEMIGPVQELIGLCEAAGREAAAPAVVGYMKLWSVDVPKLEGTDVLDLPDADRTELSAALRACVSLTEAAAAMAIVARSYDVLDDEVPDDLVSSGELIEETTAALTDHMQTWLEAEKLDEDVRGAVSIGVAGVAHLPLAFLQPMLLRAGHKDAKETPDLLDDLAGAKDYLVKAIALLGL